MNFCGHFSRILVDFSKYPNVYYEWPLAGRKILRGAVAAAGSSSVRWPKFFSQCLRRISWPWISFLGSHQIELFVRMLHPFASYASKWGQIYFQFAHVLSHSCRCELLILYFSHLCSYISWKWYYRTCYLFEDCY